MKKIIISISMLIILVGCANNNVDTNLKDVENEYGDSTTSETTESVDEVSLNEEVEEDEVSLTGEVIDKTEEVVNRTKDIGVNAMELLEEHDVAGWIKGKANEVMDELDSRGYLESTSKNESIADDEWVEGKINELGLQNNKLIQVAGGDLNPHRESNVRVNIGFGDREYWAFTNEHGQLTHVIAKEIVVQDDNVESVNSNGRYYSQMASVPGTESKEYDRGHVIADSLGGVANAYNITPQQYYLNRHGDQAYMEKVMRDAGGVSHLVAKIDYPNTSTQTPSHYTFDYVIKGNIVQDSFPNSHPAN